MADSPLELLRLTAAASSGAIPDHERYLALLAPSGNGAEPSSAARLESARRTLDGGKGDDLLGELQAVFAEKDRDEAGADPQASALRRQALEAAPGALGAIVTASPQPLTADHRLALEALVALTGRSAIRVQNGTVDFLGKAAGDWGPALNGAKDYIEDAIKSVGRIDVAGQHVGTGTVVGPGLVLTNRHVLEAFADSLRLADGTLRWFMTAAATINFDDNAMAPAQEFNITGVAAAGADKTFGLVDFAHLDLALVTVETTNAAGTKLPDPRDPIQNPLFAARVNDLFLLGYPARPDRSALIDPATNDISLASADALATMFGAAYGVKYLSPGRITAPAGKVAQDPMAWVFAHDATTLGGNSGSCAFLLGDPLGVLGLHFSGEARIANYAHSMAAVRAANVLGALGSLAWV